MSKPRGFRPTSPDLSAPRRRGSIRIRILCKGRRWIPGLRGNDREKNGNDRRGCSGMTVGWDGAVVLGQTRTSAAHTNVTLSGVEGRRSLVNVRHASTALSMTLIRSCFDSAQHEVGALSMTTMRARVARGTGLPVSISSGVRSCSSSRICVWSPFSNRPASWIVRPRAQTCRYCSPRRLLISSTAETSPVRRDDSWW